MQIWPTYSSKCEFVLKKNCTVHSEHPDVLVILGLGVRMYLVQQAMGCLGAHECLHHGSNWVYFTFELDGKCEFK